MKNKMVPIQFPPNLMEMLGNWREAVLKRMLGGACFATARSAAHRI